MEFIKQFMELFVPNISEDLLDLFSTLVEVKHFKKGEFIIKEGQIPSNFYILKSGVIRSYVVDQKGKEHIRTLYVPITTSGALSALIKKAPANATYECLTDCEILVGNYFEFLALTHKNHELSLFYIKVLEHVFIRTENRVYDLSVLDATERYLKLKERMPDIDNLIPQYHIAAYLNITPVQLSRIRKEIYGK